MRSRWSRKLSHTQTSVPCGTLNNAFPDGISALLKSPKVSITHLAIETGTQLTHHIVAMKKVAE